MDLQNLVDLTEKRVREITALDLSLLFPRMLESERELLANDLRHKYDFCGDTYIHEYYEQIGKTLDLIIYRLIQERCAKSMDDI